MSYHFKTNRQPGLPVPLDGQDIHSSWCTCSDCTLDRRRSFRLDLKVIGLGVVAALVAVATILLLGIK
jgi:hypothetical protein